MAQTLIAHHIDGTSSDRRAEYLLSTLPPIGWAGNLPCPTWASIGMLTEVYATEASNDDPAIHPEHQC